MVTNEPDHSLGTTNYDLEGAETNHKHYRYSPFLRGFHHHQRYPYRGYHGFLGHPYRGYYFPGYRGCYQCFHGR